MKLSESKNIKHDDTRRFLKLVEDTNVHVNENSIIALNYDQYDTTGYISVNCSSIGVRVNLSDFNEDYLAEDGIRIWRTWTWGDK